MGLAPQLHRALAPWHVAALQVAEAFDGPEAIVEVRQGGGDKGEGQRHGIFWGPKLPKSAFLHGVHLFSGLERLATGLKLMETPGREALQRLWRRPAAPRVEEACRGSRAKGETPRFT